MKKYRVTVNGTVYEVELEELTVAAPAPVSAPLPRLPLPPHRQQASRSPPPCPARFWP